MSCWRIRKNVATTITTPPEESESNHSEIKVILKATLASASRMVANVFQGSERSSQHCQASLVPRASIQREQSVKVKDEPQAKKRQQRERGENNPINVSVQIMHESANFLPTGRFGRLSLALAQDSYRLMKMTTVKAIF